MLQCFLRLISTPRCYSLYCASILVPISLSTPYNQLVVALVNDSWYFCEFRPSISSTKSAPRSENRSKDWTSSTWILLFSSLGHPRQIPVSLMSPPLPSRIAPVEALVFVEEPWSGLNGSWQRLVVWEELEVDYLFPSEIWKSIHRGLSINKWVIGDRMDY